jgi:hypothetical protein
LIVDIMGLFIEWPWLALVPSVLFGYAFARYKRGLVLIAAVAWFAYFPYELAMRLRLLCSGECNIRIDLLVLYPVLAIVSLIAVVSFVRSLRPSHAAERKR